MMCVTHQPFHAWQQPVPSRLTTTSAGTTPPSGAHGASHPQCRPGDLPALQLWQVQHAILPTGAGSQAVVESTPPRPGHVLHQWPRDLQSPVKSHHSTSSELTPLCDQGHSIPNEQEL